MWPTIIAVLSLIALWAWSLAAIAAPATAEERRATDEEQAKYLREYMAERLARSKPD